MAADASLTGVLLLGASLGLTACAATCMPFIGAWTLAGAGGARAGLRDALSFLGGRWLAYTSLGALAASLGDWFLQTLRSGVGNALIGAAALACAGLLLRPSAPHTAAALCRRAGHAGLSSPFLLGMALTLIPCTPLATLLTTAAASADPGQGARLGMAFGAGALLTPMLALIPACAALGQRLRAEQPWLAPCLRVGAALVLALMGWRRLATVSPTWATLALALGATALAVAHLRQRRHRRARRVIPIAPLARP